MIDQIKQAFEKIDEFREEGKFREAYSVCLEILEADPENTKAIKLSKKIESEIREAGIKAIKENIKSLEPLWTQGKYEELTEAYRRLYELAPNYEPLLELMAKAEGKLREKLARQKEKFTENFEKELLKMLEEEKFQDLIIKSSQTEAAYPSNKKIKEVGRKMRVKVAEKELEKAKPLLESRNYSKIIEFLEKLKKIEPTYKEPEKLIIKYKRKGLTNLTDEQREFVYRGISHTKTLLQLKKYESAEELIGEVLQTDPENKKAKSLLKKAQRKAKRKIQKEVVEKMREAAKGLKKEYKENKKAFIRI